MVDEATSQLVFVEINMTDVGLLIKVNKTMIFRVFVLFLFCLFLNHHSQGLLTILVSFVLANFFYCFVLHEIT